MRSISSGDKVVLIACTNEVNITKEILPITVASNNQAIPVRVSFVSALVHNSAQIAVNLFGVKTTSIITAEVLSADNWLVFAQWFQGIHILYLLKALYKVLEITIFSTTANGSPITNLLHTFNIVKTCQRTIRG